MRKIMLTIATALLTIVMCLSSLVGCNLVTVDNKRDMNQVVATVQIEDAPVETIYKKDMIIAYLNYYYQLEQQGYSRAQTFETIIENLVNNRVFVQYAMKYFSDKGMGDANDKWNIEKYLTDGSVDPEDNELLDAKYSAYKDMNDLIDSYVTDKEGDKVGDTYSETVRVVPTGATNDVELTAAEKTQYINKGIDVTERRKAFSDVINVLKSNDLLGDGEYKNNDITTTTYYKETINGYYEQALIAKFEKTITTEARAKVTLEMVNGEYERLYNIQKGYSNKEFVTALDSVSAQSPILYSGYNGYGMVYNVLLGIDEDMSADLKDITAKYQEESGTPVYMLDTYRADRKALFNSITAKDLRTSWIYSGYDFEEQELAPFSSYADYRHAFTGDYTFVKDASLPFFGNVTLLNGSEKPAAGEFDLDYKPQYRVDGVKEFSLDEFVALVNAYLYDGATATNGSSPEIYKTVTGLPKANYHERVKELMFAFSTDSSDTALNTYKGYVIKHEADMGETESWMAEFADAGRRVIAKDEGYYEIVATDYGYHFIFFGDSFNGRDYDTLEEYLNEVDDIYDVQAEYEKMLADWEDYEDTDNYLYVLVNSLASTSVNNAFTKIQQEILNDYVYTGSSVVKYTDAYADLVAE